MYSVGSGRYSFSSDLTGTGPAPAATPMPGDLDLLRQRRRDACAFTGTRQVRYGAEGLYAYGTFTDSVACTNGVFGDPVPERAQALRLQQHRLPTPWWTPRRDPDGCWPPWALCCWSDSPGSGRCRTP